MKQRTARLTRAKGLELAERYFSSKLKPQAYCTQYNVAYHILKYWCDAFKNQKTQAKTPSAPCFIPLKLPSESIGNSRLPHFKIQLRHGVVIDVPNGFDKLTLLQILEVCTPCG